MKVIEHKTKVQRLNFWRTWMSAISDAIERIDRERDSILPGRCWLCKHGPPCFTCEMDLTTTNNKG